MLTQKGKPVIFLAFANPEGDLGSLKAEFHQVKKTLEQIPSFELVVEPFASKEVLLQTFQKYRGRIAIFHYGGHADQFGLLLESTTGGQDFTAARGLAEFLSAQSGLQLVFLNGCSTDGQVKGFHRAGIPVVIGTKKPIPDVEASYFATWFYQSLATGATLDQAFTEAKGAFKTQSSSGTTRGRDVVAASEDKDSNDPKALWNLYARESTDKQWNLARASGNPLFGLPDPQHYDLPRNPFRPLSRFREQDWEIFFGRGQQIRELYNWVLDKHTHPILLLYGQSGVGKSSLLDAGLTPRLKAAGFEVRYIGRDRSTGLLDTLRKAVIPETRLAKTLRDLETKAPRPVMVILDQLEEAYTYAPSPKALQEEIEAFVAELAAIYGNRDERPQGKLILSFRKEWLAEIEAALEGRVLFSKMPPLEPLDRRGILEAINGPAQTENLKDEYNLSIADGLAEKIANDLLDRNSPIAPTLQLVLTKMWDKALISTRAPHFDFEMYEEFQQKDLGDILDQQLEKLSRIKPEETASGLALDVLAFHTTPHGTAEQRSPEELVKEYSANRTEQVTALIQACKDLYLLSDPSLSKQAISGSSVKASRLSHDTLAPYVRERFERSMLPGQRARRIIESKIKDWDGNQSPVLSSHDLSRVEQGFVGMRALQDKEAELLEASKQYEMQTSQTRQKELQRHQVLIRNFRWVRNIAMVAVVLALIGVEGQRRLAVEREVQAVSRQLVLKSPGERQDNRLLLLLEAVRLKPSHISWGGLLNGLQSVDQRYEKMLITPSSINTLEISPDGKVMACGSDNGTIGFWETSSGKLIGQTLKEHDYPIYAMAYSRDGKLMASGGDDGIQFWDPIAQRPLGKRLDTGYETIVGLAFSPDGKWLVSGGYEGTIQLWDSSKRKPAREAIHGHDKAIETVAFSPDGRILASSSDDATIRLWNSQTMELIATLKGHKGPVYGVGFSPDGKWLVSGSEDTTIKVWDLATQKPVGDPLRGHTASVYAVAVSPDGKTIASGSVDSTVRLWSLSERKPEGNPLRGHGNVVSGVAFSSDGNTLFSVSYDKSVQFWDVSKNQRSDVLQGHTDVVYDLAFNADGRKMVSASADRTIRIWDALSGSPEGTLESKTPVHALALSPDGQRLASGEENGDVVLWDYFSGKPRSFLKGHDDEVDALVFSPDGNRLFSAGMDQTIRVWDIDSGKPLGVMEEHQGIVHVLVLSPDGKVLLSGSEDKTIRLWDTKSFSSMGKPLQKHEGSVLDIALSPDGKQIASAGDDGNIQLWDFLSQEPIGEPLVGLGGSIYQVAYSTDGEMLIAGNEDGTVQLWDVKSHLPIGEPLQGHRGVITSMVYSPSRQRLATGSHDTNIHLWDLKPESWIERACKLSGRNFLPEEWARFVGSQFKYQKTCPELPIPKTTY